MAATEPLTITQIPAVDVSMGIRRPPGEVFTALVDPEVTTRFWFTKSSGPMEPGAQLTWEWEMHGASTEVTVRALEPDRRIVFDWGRGDDIRTVDIRLSPWGASGTFVRVSETGFVGNGDETVSWLTDSTGGFIYMLCALKALLEHDVILNLVNDHHPPDLES